MNKLKISHTITSTDSSDKRSHSVASTSKMLYGIGATNSQRLAVDEVDVDEDDIYTGEFIDKTHYVNGAFYSNPTYHFLKRKSKDTYVFLKDYKPKVKKIDSDISHLKKNVKSLNGTIKYRTIKWKTEKEDFNKEIDVVNGLVNDLNYEIEEQNETLEEQNEKIEEQNQTIEEQNEILEEQNETLTKLQSFMLLLSNNFNEKIEKLEKKVYDLENPPLIPELRNPFDYLD